MCFSTLHDQKYKANWFLWGFYYKNDSAGQTIKKLNEANIINTI